jgi:hypothetical protein
MRKRGGGVRKKKKNNNNWYTSHEFILDPYILCLAKKIYVYIYKERKRSWQSKKLNTGRSRRGGGGIDLGEAARMRSRSDR